MTETNPGPGVVPVIRRPDYVIYLEHFAGRVWGHADMGAATPGRLRRFAADLRLLADLQGAPILAPHRPGDAKHAKFLRLTGARFLFASEDRYGEPLEVYEYR